MASCATNIEAFLGQDASLQVSEKYKILMEDTLGEGSLYERVKDTFHELFKENNISEAEKIQLMTSNISNIAINISAQAMNTAINWAKEERDGTFQLAQIKAQTELVLAQKELTAEQICKAVFDSQLTEAQKDEVLASTIRNDALNASQIELNDASKYAQLADTFRKSGKVNIGTDADGIDKGLSGDAAGYTNTQDSFLARQEKSFEDSKRNWASNSSAAMIGQLLSAEVPITETDTAFLLWKASMDYLTQDTP